MGSLASGDLCKSMVLGVQRRYQAVYCTAYSEQGQPDEDPVAQAAEASGARMVARVRHREAAGHGLDVVPAPCVAEVVAFVAAWVGACAGPDAADEALAGRTVALECVGSVRDRVVLGVRLEMAALQLVEVEDETHLATRQVLYLYRRSECRNCANADAPRAGCGRCVPTTW